MDFIGGLAALLAALAFSFASTLFTLSGRQFAPGLVNRASLPISLVCLFVLQWLITGQPFPSDAEPVRWVWLGASGLVGFWLVFTALMNAFARIGPRLALLFGALSPILSTFLGWVFLGETLDAGSLIGIALTLGGIVWVVSADKRNGPTEASPTAYRTGVLFALGAAVGQAVALILSKQGLAGDFEPLTGTFMRILVTTAVIWLFTLARGQVTSSLRTLREQPRAFRLLGAGALAGPVMGASLVMVAVQRADVGVASTLLNLTPIFLIPIGYVVFHETITRRAIFGTMVAVTGTAILFL